MSEHHHQQVSEARGRTIAHLRRAVSCWQRAYEDLYRQHEALRADLGRVYAGPAAVRPRTIEERLRAHEEGEGD